MLAYTVLFRTFRSIESVSQLAKNIAHGLSRRQDSERNELDKLFSGDVYSAVK